MAWIGAGIAALGAYGFVATLQDDADFGRILAAYGGIFVAGSLAWGMDDWTRALADVTDRTGIDGGLRLQLSVGSDLADLARLIVAEQGCCAFYRFALTVDERGIALEVTAPEDAATVLASLFGEDPPRSKSAGATVRP